MSSSQGSYADFQASCHKSSEYPMNLLRSDSWEHSLSAYAEQFSSSAVEGRDLFACETEADKSKIFVLDYSQKTKSFETPQAITDFEQLKGLVNDSHEDSVCRYFFIHAKSSRDPLKCSREQLAHVLSHHQAMAPFLDHVFTFSEREEPHLLASFQTEDFLNDTDTEFGFAELGRSGLQVQHCFNLVGVECEKKRYRYRQTAAYYSFDPIKGKSVWFVLKANEMMRDRLDKSIASSRCRRNIGDVETNTCSFSLGLISHLLIFEWCTENWTSFVDSFQKRLSEAAFVRYTSITKLTGEETIDKRMSRKTTFRSGTQSRQNSGFLTSRSLSWNGLAEVSRKLKGTAKSSTVANGPQSQPEVLSEPRKVSLDGLDLDEIFSIDQLQSLHRLASELEEANLVLAQNKGVLEGMEDRFQRLCELPGFKSRIQVDGTNLSKFLRGVQRCIRELDKQQARLNALQADLDKDVSLFNGILQYKNMRTGEYFASHAKMSTEKMEELTVKTKQETVSMHVITILTLFFLPGTFVAVRYGLPPLYAAVSGALTSSQTFFSSGILDFGDATHNTSLRGIGDWGTEWNALRLFALICGPLMGVVLSAWALAYYLARRQRRVPLPGQQSADEEKGKGAAT